MQLDVLKEFYAQHDVKVRQELAKEKEIRSSMAGDLATFADREKFMKGEIEEYKRVRLELVKNQEEDRKNRTLMTNVSHLRGDESVLLYEKFRKSKGKRTNFGWSWEKPNGRRKIFNESKIRSSNNWALKSKRRRVWRTTFTRFNTSKNRKKRYVQKRGLGLKLWRV